jgi:hypothetical protein
VKKRRVDPHTGKYMYRSLVFVMTLLAFTNTGNALSQAKNTDSQKYPDVIDVKVKSAGENRFDFDVTLSSPYDSPQRYADAFRVKSLEGKVYGERILLHDHVNEQPFTRDLYGVNIPAGVRLVVVEGRDQKYGYGGKTMQLTVPER